MNILRRFAAPPAMTPGHVSTLSTHFAGLDGLRALAFLFVFLDHWSLISGGRGGSGVLEGLALKVADAGWCGVDLFFVLSGFLITGILLDTRGEWDYFSNFYLRRTLRIFPIYYAFLFVVFVALRPFAWGVTGYPALASRQVWYWLYLQNWSTALSGWPLVGMDHLWSLAVEEQFYLLWPLVVFMGGLGWTKRASIAFIALPFAARICFREHPTFVYASTLTRVDALAAGSLVAAMLRERGGAARLKRAALPLSGAALVGLLVLAAVRGGLAKLDPVVAIVGFSLFGALFTGIILFAITRPSDHPVLRALATPRLRALGRISYAAYIVHYPVMRFFDAALPKTMAPHARLGLGFVVPAVLTVGLSIASWRAFEEPLLRFKDRVSPPSSRRVRSREAPDGAPVRP